MSNVHASIWIEAEADAMLHIVGVHAEVDFGFVSEFVVHCTTKSVSFTVAEPAFEEFFPVRFYLESSTIYIGLGFICHFVATRFGIFTIMLITIIKKFLFTHFIFQTDFL